MNKNTTKILLIVLFSVLFIFAGFYLSTKNQKEQTANKQQIIISPTPTPYRQKAYVNYVFDGDTIEISPKITVRLLGMNTPEIANKYDRFKEECYGPEATKITKELLMGQNIQIEKDIEDKDKYGRLLRYVWIDDVFVNEFLVRNGYAKLEEKTINIKYKDLLVAAEKEAKVAKRGLWGKCVRF